MSDKAILTESQMVGTFGRAIANRVRILTASTDAVFEEFEFKGRTYLGGYDYCRESYYILPAQQVEQQQGGTIITIRTKQEKKPQPRRRLEVAHSR